MALRRRRRPARSARGTTRRTRCRGASSSCCSSCTVACSRGPPPRATARSSRSARGRASRFVGRSLLFSCRLGSSRLVSSRLGPSRLGSARLGSARLVSSRLFFSRLAMRLRRAEYGGGAARKRGPRGSGVVAASRQHPRSRPLSDRLWHTSSFRRGVAAASQNPARLLELPTEAVDRRTPVSSSFCGGRVRPSRRR